MWEQDFAVLAVVRAERCVRGDLQVDVSLGCVWAGRKVGEAVERAVRRAVRHLAALPRPAIFVVHGEAWRHRKVASGRRPPFPWRKGAFGGKSEIPTIHRLSGGAGQPIPTAFSETTQALTPQHANPRDETPQSTAFHHATCTPSPPQPPKPLPPRVPPPPAGGGLKTGVGKGNPTAEPIYANNGCGQVIMRCVGLGFDIH